MSEPLESVARPTAAGHPDLSRRRCLNHPGREAAARCPECRRDFCRECVTEHGDRVVCSACLTRLSGADAGRRRSLAWLAPAAALLGGLVTAWLYFYLVAQILLLFPQSVDPAVGPKPIRPPLQDPR